MIIIFIFFHSRTLEKSNSFIQTFLDVEKLSFNSKGSMENFENDLQPLYALMEDVI